MVLSGVEEGVQVGLDVSQGGWKRMRLEKGGRAEAVWGSQGVHRVQLVGSFLAL